MHFLFYIFLLSLSPPGQEVLIRLASLAWLKSASRLTVSWLRQPTYRLKSVSRLTAPTGWLLVVISCRLVTINEPWFSTDCLVRPRLNSSKKINRPYGVCDCDAGGNCRLLVDPYSGNSAALRFPTSAGVGKKGKNVQI